MSYTPGFNFYLPEIDDKNTEYVPGFQRNFEMLDKILSTLVNQSIVDKYATDPKQLDRKRVVTDRIISVYEGHKDGITFLTEKEKHESTAGETYLKNAIENPHGITPSQLFSEKDLDSSRSSAYELLTPSGVYNPKKNQGHNAIIDEINNNISDDAGQVAFPTDRSKKIKGYGNTNGNIEPIIDYSNTYIQDIGNNKKALTESYEPYVNEQERIDAKKYRNHKYLYVDTENQLVDEYINNPNLEINQRRDRHISLKDANHFESHIRNKGQYTDNEIRNKYTDMLTNPVDVSSIIKNPHNVTATELCDSYSPNNTTDTGSKAIVKEINTLAKHSDIEYKHQNDKIYWELIDKTSITSKQDGQPKKPSIADILDHEHNSLSGIHGVDLKSEDTLKDKHISNKEGKKWEDHTNTELQNPHKTKANQLYKKDNTYEGTLDSPKSTVAIIEQINIDNDLGLTSSHSVPKPYDNKKILWNVIDKENIDGIGGKANITDIPLREHDNLQNIHIININDKTYEKNKHISNLQLNSLYRYINVKDGENIHRISPSALIGLPKSPEHPVKNEVTLNYVVIDKKVSINMPTIDNKGVNLDLYIELVFTQEISTKHTNIDLYFNEYYLGQVNDEQNRSFIIPIGYVESNNNLIMYWNEETPTNETCKIITKFTYYQQEKYIGRDAIIDEINVKNTEQDKIFKKILWERIEKDTSKLDEITNRPHRMLQDVLGYEILDDPNDPSDNNKTRNKHISCEDGQRWDNHVSTTNGSNPHKLKIENIEGINTDRKGPLAIFDELNKHALANHSNKGLDKVGDNQITWHAISKKEMSFEDFPQEGKDHQKLTNILPITFMENINNITDEDRKANKHITNQQATKFNNHVDTISEITGTEDTNKLVNPHKLSAASLLSHKRASATLNSEFTGGNAIIDAINDYGDNYSLLWNKLSKQDSSISDLIAKDHSLLDNIRKPNINTQTKEEIYDLHISQTEYNNWENHRLNMENPHNVKVSQIQNKDKSFTGPKAIIDDINTYQTEGSAIKINHNNINFGKDETRNLEEFNITGIPLRNHDDLQNVITISGEEYVETKGHVLTSQVKAWTDHLKDQTNPHKVIAEQVELGLTSEEKKNHSLESETLKQALFEIDEFRNRTTVGLASIMFEPPKLTNGNPDPEYYFDKDKTAIYVPICEVYLNNQPGFRGKIKKYKTPTVSINEDLPKEIEDKFGRNCYKIPLTSVPKEELFVIYAYLDSGTAKLGVSQSNSLTHVTDGQNVNIMKGYITTEKVAEDTKGNTGIIKEAYCIPTSMTALGMSERLFNRTLFLQPTARQSGMSLYHDLIKEIDLTPDGKLPEGITSTLFFGISEGSLWDGLQLTAFQEFRSRNIRDKESKMDVILCIRNNPADSKEGVKWVYQYGLTTIPNDKCQGLEGGLVDVPRSTIDDITEGKIIDNISTTFVYYVPAYRRVYLVMSEKLLSSADQLDVIGNRIFPKALPDLVKSAGILVGLILCKNGPISIQSKTEGIGYEVLRDGNIEPVRIYSPFDLIFTNTTTDVSTSIEHNQLKGKLGKPDYYHLGTQEYKDLAFIIDTEQKKPDDHGETGFDRKITKLAVDHRITELLKDGKVDESVDTIVEIAKNTYDNSINKMGKRGDSATGEYIFGTTPEQSNVVSIDANNGPASIFIGNQELTEKTNGFYIGYKDSTLTLYSQNGNNTNTAEDPKNVKVFDVNSQGLFKVYTDFSMSDLNISKKITITNGLTSTDNIDIKSDDAKYALILGTNINQGTVLYKHNKDNSSTVMRARNEKFEIDTFGGLFINTDRSREEKNTQSNPSAPKNLKYLDESGKAIYDVFIGNIGTTSQPKYPIILSNKEHSKFLNGMIIGETFGSETSSKLLINGDVSLNNKNINGINKLSLTKYDIYSSSSDNIGKISLDTKELNGNLALSISGQDVFNCTFSKTKVDLIANAKVGISLTDSVQLNYNGAVKLTTIQDGVRVNGNIYSNSTKVALETRRVNVSGGLSGGGSLAQDITIGLSPASDTQIGGVKVDNKTIISNAGTITAKALKDAKFTMEYDNAIQGVVIKFN